MSVSGELTVFSFAVFCFIHDFANIFFTAILGPEERDILIIPLMLTNADGLRNIGRWHSGESVSKPAHFHKNCAVRSQRLTIHAPGAMSFNIQLVVLLVFFYQESASGK